MNKLKKELLNLLGDNARYTYKQLADITGVSESGRGKSGGSGSRYRVFRGV